MTKDAAGVAPLERQVRLRVQPLAFAVFDEFGNCADDRVWDYAYTAVAAERERCAKLCDEMAAECPKDDSDRDAIEGAAARIRAS